TGVPVVALVRRSREMVSLFEGTSGDQALLQVSLTTGPDGSAQSWVRVPPGYRVVHAILGLAPASPAIIDPKIDVGADGAAEWAFSGTLDSGVTVHDLEGGFNLYLETHASEPGNIDVPVRVTAGPDQVLILNGVQLFLENDVPGDFDFDRDVDADDLAVFAACATGPGIPQSDPACVKARLDGDDDVDSADFGIFQRCLSAADTPADPGCAN
ncbi:MAG: hypothetical protein HY718_07610, partial [Planctomycetes bacterium]|nr:hypothetical protein [Planctomycetota bacterium]